MHNKMYYLKLPINIFYNLTKANIYIINFYIFNIMDDSLTLNNYHVKILTDNEKKIFNKIIKSKYIELNDYYLNFNIILHNGESIEQYLENVYDEKITILLPVISKIKYRCFIGFRSQYKSIKLKHISTQNYSILNFKNDKCIDLKYNQPITSGILSYLQFEEIDITQTMSMANEKIIYHLQNLFILLKETIIIDDISKYIFKYLIEIIFNDKKMKFKH